MADGKQSRSLGNCNIQVNQRSVYISIIEGGLLLTIDRPIKKYDELPDMREFIVLLDITQGLVFQK